jgi:hypothetical protein
LDDAILALKGVEQPLEVSGALSAQPTVLGPAEVGHFPEGKKKNFATTFPKSHLT